MIRNFNDHAANERTLLAWARTGLSAIALGIVVKKGSLFALVIAGASSSAISGSTQDHLGSYGGSALVGIGIAAIGGAAVRFVRTALRIDDQVVHSVGIVRLASALLHRRRGDSEAIEPVSTNAESVASGKRNRGDGQLKLRLISRTNACAVR